ncbi:hypothetical membrane protein [Renibacterium salmoninarum ATCC 33209]|uniref:Hypothetical membrane protein n=2 Tax=Renibacterium salmoninarum TaxID=1646 RepID=A9WLL5_RENSM|nr:hypothetical protein [Renibacterium salmoninarum]ABY22373.1 hypothetical membrane protein [Renibacterium salmoninarum ATCC 33209]
MTAVLGHAPSAESVEMLNSGGVVVPNALLLNNGFADIGLGDSRQQIGQYGYDLQWANFPVTSSVR